MGFVPISVDDYLNHHFKNASLEEEADMRMRIAAALIEYESGVTCACGNKIWVAGSALVGSSCFSCITGESRPNNDFEIDLAIDINDRVKDLNIPLDSKFNLCNTCANLNNASDQFLCNAIRDQHHNDGEFTCFSYID